MVKLSFDFPMESGEGRYGLVISVTVDNFAEAEKIAYAERDIVVTETGDMPMGNPEVIRKDRLPVLRPFRLQTLQQPNEGTVYTHSSDYVTCRFLPGRNVVVAEAYDLESDEKIIATFQVHDFLRFWAERDVTLFPDYRGEAAFELLQRADVCYGAVVTR